MRLTHASTHVLLYAQDLFLSPLATIVLASSRYYCTPRGTKVSCCFAPTGQSFVFLSPHCLSSSSSSLSSDVNSTNSYDLSFWRALDVYIGSSVMRISNDTDTCTIELIVRDQVADTAGISCAATPWSTRTYHCTFVWARVYMYLWRMVNVVGYDAWAVLFWVYGHTTAFKAS